MPNMKRRSFLAVTAAFVAHPGAAQTQGWQGVAAQARSSEQCHAIVIQQRGVPVLSERFRGPALDRVVPIKSVSKTIVAALTGAALDRGEIPSLDATLGEVAPGLIPPGADTGVAAITVGNLVTMQAGLERTSGANYGGWVSSSNWVANALSRPMVAEPGAQMLYSTGTTHVLGAVLSQVSGESLLSLARARLGRPLGIDIPAWTRDPQGRYLGGNEMALSLSAMIRFGEMYRNAGRAGDTQVLSQAWVRASFQPATRSVFSGLEYGYGWFLGRAGRVEYALARGYGGQIICVIPDLALTVAITSDPTQPARSGGYFGALIRLIDQSIIPTAQRDVT
ncbi:serine hydrolase domain-containing protein [Tateyamaria pelophila]|uniref:serine hydrolase domain-containing protein n=1 Tax=Tateyamaria pelophila TaxID=328415 RepID=UPI001CBD46D6|nr:serine hydrolase [Tateyamaria pelophila]